MPGKFRAAYDERLESGALNPDPAQAGAVAALERLEGDLAEARPGGLFRKPDQVRGVYLWGPVGRGKSMLMDLFFETAPVEKKRRVHFNAFMAEVQGLVNAWRTGDIAARQARFGTHRGDDPVAPTAELIAAGARLLCFDEFQVTDIADAMILGRLFEQLFARGVTVAATSNRAPDDLYKDGLNRQLFLPFIEMLKGRMEVVAVAGPTDYRLDRLRAAGTWFSPIDPDNEASFDRLWREMLGGDAETGATLEVYGRKQHWPRAAGRLLRAHFQSLCAEALGPSDYLAIAARFDTLFLEALPRLRPEDRSAARRLATLIDTLYEAHARLVVLAAAEPARLYPEGEGSFEFERAASRLEEMRSATWLEAAPETADLPASR
ncbi:MAG TPA: cell division protein ZapE [Caulobacteraceae bacterium]|nr:cell division protein ZapE [Caulobacteraceae bacterium]